MSAGEPIDEGGGRWPEVAGRLAARTHVLPIRVYFEDTDMSGLVYHASYLRFLERGRTDFLRLLGIGHSALLAGEHGEPLFFAVRSLSIEFVRPAAIDDLLEVVTTPGAVQGARCLLSQEVRRGAVTLVQANVTVALVNAAGRPRRIPLALRDRLQSFVGPG
ncbi:MAG: YbgC/FadM family acyl-CoA thioesterase [Bauldia sp.]